MTSRSPRSRDLRLLPVVGVAWAGAGVAISAPDAAGLIAAILWGTAVAALAIAAGRRARSCSPRRSSTGSTRLTLCAVALAFAAAAASHVAFALPARVEVAELEIGGGRTVTFEADVVGKIESSPTGYRFDAVLRGVTVGPADRRVTAPVLVRTAERPPGLDLGARVGVTATAFPADAGRREVLVVSASAIDVHAPPSGVLAIAASLRMGLLDAVTGLPQPGAGLVPGLAVGDTSAVDPELDAQMKASSLSHLTAVSGANCALVVGMAFGVAALCGARRGIRVGVGIVTLIAFVVLVSPEPSVVRAGTMAAIAMLGVLMGRVGAGVSVLCASVCVLLLIDPWLAASLGFALSTVATGSLLLFAGPLADGLARWMPAPLALAVSVPLAAQLACGPLLILLEPSIPVLGVLANMLAGPAAPLATVFGLLACLALPVPVLAQGLAALAWLPAAWIAATARITAGVPGASVAWLEGLPGLVTLATTGVAIGLAVGSRRASVRRGAGGVCVAVLLVVIAAGPVSLLVSRARVPGDWAIAACDVGQGDAVLVRDAGSTMLIDTGPDAASATSCLDRFAIDRVDVLVLTHFDLDHRGGADGLVGRVGLVLHGPTASAEDEKLIATFTSAGARTLQVAAGQHGVLGSCHWNVLWPKPRDPVFPSGNDASVVVDVSGCRAPAAVFLGDLSAAAQRALMASGALAPTYDVVKVAHHGSADQDEELYRNLEARVALVTVGENSYGHPRDEILHLLSAEGARLARTDLGGDLAVWADDSGLQVWRSRGGVGAAG